MLSMTYGQLGRQILTTVGRVEGNTGEEILRNLTDGQVTACILTNVVEELIAARQQIGEYQRTLVRELQEMRDVAKTLTDNETIFLENQRTLMQYLLKPRDEPQFAPDPVFDALATDAVPNPDDIMDTTMLTTRAKVTLRRLGITKRSEIDEDELMYARGCGDKTTKELLDFRDGKLKGTSHGSDLCDELNEVGNAENTTRQEYLDWCKKRALAYVDAGEIPQALVSFLSDVSKHAETAHIQETITKLGVELFLSGVLNTPTKMRNHIKGYT